MNTKTIVKFFSSPEKEEAWLDEQARQGWLLSRVTGFPSYVFVKAAPEKRVYKMDYRAFKNPADRADYLALFADSGWQAVMSKEVNGAFYFTAVSDVARADIFSDEVSRAGRDLRFAKMSCFSLFPALVPILALYLGGGLRPGSAVYLTPGLWEMTGWHFWSHFLFETPFAIFRTAPVILPLIPLGMMLYFLGRYYRSYRQAVRRQTL